MRMILGSVVVVLALCISCVSFASNWDSTLSQYSCLEVEKIQVDRNDFSTKKMERAAAFPEEMRASLQHKIVGEISRENIVPAVRKSGCTGKTLIYGGKLTDYKKGSRAARIMIGMGAGKQKIEVDSYLKDRSTGQVLATKKVVDRKFGGIAGGDEAKGERDFAEKVARFVKTGN